MEKIRFLNTTAIYDGVVNFSGSNVISITFNGAVPTTEITNGFEFLNEHNGIVQAEFPDFTTIYKTYEDNPNRIELSNDGSVYVEPEPIPEPEPTPPNPYVPTEDELQEQFEFAKQYKIDELSSACESAIYTGVDVGEKHYSYTLQDQTNLENAISIATQTSMDVPYHADGESCALYTLSQLKTIYMAEQINLTTHQTYFNQMKQYIINTFTDMEMIEDLQKISYGDELTGEYLDAYNTIIEQSTLIMNELTK